MASCRRLKIGLQLFRRPRVRLRRNRHPNSHATSATLLKGELVLSQITDSGLPVEHSTLQRRPQRQRMTLAIDHQVALRRSKLQLDSAQLFHADDVPAA